MLPLRSEELEIMAANLQEIAAEVAEMFLPPEHQSTIEWLEKNYVLPDFGLYDFYYAPYFLGVANAIDDPEVREIVLMKAAQIGWTFLLLGVIFKKISEAGLSPIAIMMLFAKTNDGKNFHDEKLKAAVKASELMSSLLDISQRSGNRWDNKTYPGGFIKIVGSNSPGNVKSTSKVGLAIIEEPDDTTDNVAGQGGAITLIEERLKRFVGSLLMVGGTPAVKGLSKTAARLKKSDRRQLPISCHNCEAKHILDWSNVYWDEDEHQNHETYGSALPETAIYRCPHCGFPWNDNQRKQNVRDTCYNALNAGDPLAGWTATKDFDGVAGFQDLSELYVCMDGTSLADVVRSYLEAEAEAAKGDENGRRAFINQKLGKEYEFKGDHATAEQLRELCKDYDEMVVPRDCFMLTAGVDVQRNPARLAVVIRAWGRNGLSRCIYWGELSAHLTTVDPKDGVWNDLDTLLFQPFKTEAGYPLFLSAVSIDSSDGFTSDAVYNWVRLRKWRSETLIMAVKGSSARTDPEIFVTPRQKSIDHKKPEKATKADKRGVKVYIVGTNKAKDWIAGQLKLLTEGVNRFLYYTGIRDDYFDQILGEVKAPDKSGRMTWQEKSGHPHEVLDCEVYALHAARARRVHLKTPEQWDALEHELSQTDLFGLPDPEPEKQPEQTPEPAPVDDDWMGGYADGDDWL